MEKINLNKHKKVKKSRIHLKSNNRAKKEISCTDFEFVFNTVIMCNRT